MTQDEYGARLDQISAQMKRDEITWKQWLSAWRNLYEEYAASNLEKMNRISQAGSFKEMHEIAKAEGIALQVWY